MISVHLSKQVEALNIELQKFAQNIQNNIHVGALRVASNVIKDEMISIDMQTTGDKGQYKKNLKKSDVRVRKRRRTKTGWERFKVSIKHEEDEPQKKGSWHYNIITNSKEKLRFTKARKRRGVLKRDPFIQRATKYATNKAMRGYIYYMRTRILADGAKISTKTINNAKKNGF